MMSSWFIIFCCLTTLVQCADPLDCSNKNGGFVDDIQTGSFVVNANYNVQGHQKDAASNYWQTSTTNFQQEPSYSVYKNPSVTNAGSFGYQNNGNVNEINRIYDQPHFQYNYVADQVKEPSTVSNNIVFPSNDVIDQGNAWSGLERGVTLRDSNKPSVRELEQVIKKLIQGSTRVHQVVKVPAMYEIHLHADRDSAASRDTPQAPQPHSWESNNESQNRWRNVDEHANQQQATKYWSNDFQPSPTGISEIPSPVLEAESFKHLPSPPYKYSWPSKNSVSNQTNIISSFNVPISPGSTIVKLTNYQPTSSNYLKKTQLIKTRDVTPSLSLYYAKKRQMEKEKAQYKTSHRRTTVSNVNAKKPSQKLYKKQDTVRYTSPPLLNYMIYVKEKPENRRIIYV
ncbi:hypothetical protein GWI33_012727 [Rhynchophorus ferrugineus]|uniref:Uncharacterized protein n=1 Tax=Rhynchophorus ferrugineus TaxID=354439 RepID=A0A834M7A7_RHYFE|nr:hypothetical protein GWI33_012727 [Rhynchophorus ferrugineus]